MTAVIYTDGSCIKNNVHDSVGFGGWGYVIILENGDEISASGGCESTTHNRMELTAVIKALKRTPNSVNNIFSDSLYVVESASGTWRKNKNVDLWAEYNVAIGGKAINWTWVRGHSGNKYNEIADRLANGYARKLKLEHAPITPQM